MTYVWNKEAAEKKERAREKRAAQKISVECPVCEAPPGTNCYQKEQKGYAKWAYVPGTVRYSYGGPKPHRERVHISRPDLKERARKLAQRRYRERAALQEKEDLKSDKRIRKAHEEIMRMRPSIIVEEARQQAGWDDAMVIEILLDYIEEALILSPLKEYLQERASE